MSVFILSRFDHELELVGAAHRLAEFDLHLLPDMINFVAHFPFDESSRLMSNLKAKCRCTP